MFWAQSKGGTLPCKTVAWNLNQAESESENCSLKSLSEIWISATSIFWGKLLTFPIWFFWGSTASFPDVWYRLEDYICLQPWLRPWLSEGGLETPLRTSWLSRANWLLGRILCFWSSSGEWRNLQEACLDWTNVEHQTICTSCLLFCV